MGAPDNPEHPQVYAEPFRWFRSGVYPYSSQAGPSLYAAVWRSFLPRTSPDDLANGRLNLERAGIAFRVRPRISVVAQFNWIETLSAEKQIEHVIAQSLPGACRPIP